MGDLTLYYAAVGCYLAASSCGIARLVRADSVPVWPQRMLLLLAVLLHAAFIGVKCSEADANHLFNSPFHKMLLISWASAVALLAFDCIVGLPSLGGVGLPVVTAAVICVRFMSQQRPPVEGESLLTSQGVLHIITALPSYGVVFVGFVSGALYLVLERSMKRKHTRVLEGRLPPLARLEKGTGLSLLVGFGLFTVTVGAGLLLARVQPIRGDPKLYSAGVVWAVLAASSVLRLLGKLRGRRVVWATVFNFMLMIAQAILVRHEFAGA